MEERLSMQQGANGLSTCVVQACTGDYFLVLGALGMTRATRAAGCLLMPEIGDTVLVACMEAGKSWILSVLVKKTEQGALALPKATSACVDFLSLEAQTHIVTSEHVTIHARRMHVLGSLLKLEPKALVLKGTQLLQGFSVIRTFADRLAETVARHTARYGKTRQDVMGVCETNAQRMRVSCETSLRMRADNADIKAKTHLDLDAEHIRVG